MLCSYRGDNIDWISSAFRIHGENPHLITYWGLREDDHLVSSHGCKNILQFPTLIWVGWGTAQGINKFLLAPQVPILKFRVRAMSLTVRRKVDRWMLSLSKQDMKDLPVEFEGSACPEVPSCLFDYRKLTHMVLSNCHLCLLLWRDPLILRHSSLAWWQWIVTLVGLIGNAHYSSVSNDTIMISAPKVKFMNL